jgi:hypothetical protein
MANVSIHRSASSPVYRTCSCAVLALNDSWIGKSRQKAAPGRANSTLKEYYSIVYKKVSKELADLGAERVLPLLRPKPAPNESPGFCQSTQHVDEQADGVVGDVGRVNAAGVGNDDATSRALVEINVVDARGCADDAAQGGHGVEERGVPAEGPAPHDHRGARRLRQSRGGGEEGREWLAGGEEVEDAEAFAQRRTEGRVHASDEEERREGLRRGDIRGCHS